jgi:succinoglycan biosynthesis transport protein ExoP
VQRLVQRLFLMPDPEAVPQVVLFAFVGAGNGGSRLCARVAERRAAEGRGSVCVVDTNLHFPVLHQFFGMSGKKGLTEALCARGAVRSFVEPVAGSNLWVMSCGSAVAEVGAHLSPERLRACTSELRAEFDCVLIDAPPTSFLEDLVVLGRVSDGVVLVVEANATRRETARKAKESLEAANVRLLGAVLTERTFPLPEALYRYL